MSAERAPLLTQVLRREIPPLETLRPGQVAHVKYFSGEWIWYATTGSIKTGSGEMIEMSGGRAVKNDEDVIFYGLIVSERSTLGYFSLRELEGHLGPNGEKVERDKWFKPSSIASILKLHGLKV